MERNYKTRKAVIKLLADVGEDYASKKKIIKEDMEIEEDIHAFYRLYKDPEKVLHIQAYPSMSNKRNVKVRANILDYNKMIELRLSSNVPSRNGDKYNNGAVIQNIPKFKRRITLPNDPKALEARLEESVEELR